MLNRRLFSLGAALAVTGCTAKTETQAAAPAPAGLAAARAAFKTTLHYASSSPDPVAKPPKSVFSVVEYTSAVGPLPAYLTPDPKDGAKHPAIVWITGGESNTIGDVWSPRPRDNDQSAAAYRQAGIVMMFPSLRGGNRNPGQIEACYGEVDDVLAAADYLAGLPYVDPARVYLGGHSTGGTLAMLVAEVKGARFRAVFASGPVEDVSLYGTWYCPYDFKTFAKAERILRAPGAWLSSAQGKLFVIEGDQQGNIEDLRIMKARNTNPVIDFIEVPNASHFSVLAAENAVIARKIVADTGSGAVFSLSAAEITAELAEG